MKEKSGVILREAHNRAMRKWLNRFVALNLVWISIFLIGGWISIKALKKDVQLIQLTERYEGLRIRLEILDILKLKGLSVGQGLDIANVIVTQAHDLGIPVKLCLAVINKESEYYPNAKSSAGAMGLMQVMPDTFDNYNKALKLGLTRQAAFDPIVNVKIATHYLKDLLTEFKPLATSEHDLWKKVLTRYSGGAVGYVDKVKKLEKEYDKKINVTSGSTGALGKEVMRLYGEARATR